MDRKQIADLRKKVVDLLRAAETDPTAKPQAEKELARFIRDVARAEARAWGFSHRDAQKRVNAEEKVDAGQFPSGEEAEDTEEGVKAEAEVDIEEWVREGVNRVFLKLKEDIT